MQTNPKQWTNLNFDLMMGLDKKSGSDNISHRRNMKVTNKFHVMHPLTTTNANFMVTLIISLK